MSPTVWHCRECGAAFEKPSSTDASDVVDDGRGPRYESRAYLICPECYSARIFPAGTNDFERDPSKGARA